MKSTELQWFRWWVGTATDPKLTTVARRAKQKRTAVLSVWVTLLESAATTNSGGAYDIPADEIAVVLEMKPDHVAAILSALEERGLIADGCVANWDKRQFASDCSTARVRKHRHAFQRQDDAVPETFHTHDGAVTETFQERFTSGDETFQERFTSGDETFQERFAGSGETFLKRDETPSEENRGETEENRGETEGEGRARAQEETFHEIDSIHAFVGHDQHLLAPEAGVWRQIVQEVSPRIPHNCQGKPSLRAWGIALAEVCTPGSNYPLSREEIEQALRDDPPDITKWPEKWLAYHADKARAERNRRQRANAPPELTAAELREEAARRRAREQSEEFFEIIGRNPDGTVR